MQSSEFNALKELLTIGAVAPGVTTFIVGMVILLFVARIVNNSTKPVMSMVTATNENFEKVLDTSTKATERYEERVQEHRETSNRFLEVIEGYQKVQEAQTSVLQKLEARIEEQAQTATVRQTEFLTYVGNLVNSINQNVAVHDKQARERYESFEALAIEVRDGLTKVQQEIRILVDKPAFQIDLTPITDKLDALLKAIERFTTPLPEAEIKTP